MLSTGGYKGHSVLKIVKFWISIKTAYRNSVSKALLVPIFIVGTSPVAEFIVYKMHQFVDDRVSIVVNIL